MRSFILLLIFLLYLSPVVGIGYTLNAREIEISDRSFNRSPIMPWGTVGIGWSF